MPILKKLSRIVPGSAPNQTGTVLLIGSLIIMVLLIIVVLSRFGAAYERGLSSVLQNQQPQQLSQTVKRKNVRKVTVLTSDAGCMEVTPDGVVRMFKTCGTDLSGAARLTNTRDIQRLFRLTTENDLSMYQSKPSGAYTTIIIHSDDGDQTVYIPHGGQGPTPPAGEIIIIIDQIGGDIPSLKPRPTSGPTPTNLPPGVTQTPTPTAEIVFGDTPTPTPSITLTEQPFSCDFSADSKNRPVTVSNTLCSSAPTPGPLQ
jgi:hypothetical protein